MPGYLTTKRMLIRQFTIADLGWLAALHGDPALMRYIGGVMAGVPRGCRARRRRVCDGRRDWLAQA